MSVRLVILDRDGVINHDSDEFIKCADEWQPIDGSIEAIARLTNAGYTVAVASNQSGIGRGLLDLVALSAIHKKMRRQVTATGGSIDHIVFCPHLPDDGCDCRKPLPGLLRQIAEHYGTMLDNVPVIGDSLRDLEAAVAAGARPILVRTGNGRSSEAMLEKASFSPAVFDDLAAAADWLVADSGARR